MKQSGSVPTEGARFEGKPARGRAQNDNTVTNDVFLSALSSAAAHSQWRVCACRALCSGVVAMLPRPGRMGCRPLPSRAPDTSNYTLFEAGAVRPMAVLDRGTVAVTNIPDDRVELFEPHGHGVKHCGSVKVGMRPVALSVVGSKLWVVNHLSDSVSVVDVDERHCSGRGRANAARRRRAPGRGVGARGERRALGVRHRGAPRPERDRSPRATTGIRSSPSRAWAGPTSSSTRRATSDRSTPKSR